MSLWMPRVATVVTDVEYVTFCSFPRATSWLPGMRGTVMMISFFARRDPQLHRCVCAREVVCMHSCLHIPLRVEGQARSCVYGCVGIGVGVRPAILVLLCFLPVSESNSPMSVIV